MEYHIPKSSDSQSFQDAFNFNPGNLADIPCPDDICAQPEGSIEDNDELPLPPGTSPNDFADLHLPLGTSSDDFPDLPLPPGTSPDDFPIPLPPKPKSLNIITNDLFPSLSQNKAFETTSTSTPLASEEFDILSHEDANQKADKKTDEFQEIISDKQADFLDDSRYSPSKMDSDEEIQDFITIKPKVLGKEQAKKRLMAFSLSKQPSALVKKQNKAITPAKNKEKPPNPNKGSNVQEQFRATITAIEEEKKKMFQNMPSYLILEMSELAKSHSAMSSSLQLLEKLKSNADSKNKDNSSKDGNTSNKTSDRKGRSFRKSRSQSKGKKSRRSRSRSWARRSHSRSRRSHNRSHGRRSREKNYKSEKVLRESQFMMSKKKFKDWKSFKDAGQDLKSESEVTKSRSDEFKSRRDEHHKRSRSPKDCADSKSVTNASNNSYGLMTFFQARPADSGSSEPVLFLEKAVKFTKTKPVISWSESKSRASELHLSKEMLLENCDETTGSILLSITENKTTDPLKEDKQSRLNLETSTAQSRLWYPRNGLMPVLVKSHEDLKADESHLRRPQEIAEGQKSDEKEFKDADSEYFRKRSSLERKISLVNDSYLSDEEDRIKEMVVGEVKVQLDLDMNRVKVHSKWDSDYEGEISEKEANFPEEESKKPAADKVPPEESALLEAKNKLIHDTDIAPCSEIVQESNEKNKPISLNITNSKPSSDRSPDFQSCTGNLVSEYEEFLKMVSVDSNDNHDNQIEKFTSEGKSKTEKMKVKKVKKLSEGSQKAPSPKPAGTDWDQESDIESKSVNRKTQFHSNESHDKFLILRKKERLDLKFEKNEKKILQKKTEKLKLKKKRLLKKSGKTKKKKVEESYSEDDFSSDSYESDSESDSDDSDSSQKKKKKSSTSKKKSKGDSSSESDDYSDDSKTKKKKSSKKKGKKKTSRSSSSDDNDEVPAALLKQLDFKKQFIMKTIEEIDSLSDKSSKKKEKEKRERKREKESPEESDSDKYVKSDKKKKTETKTEKDKKKSKGSSKKAERLPVKGKKPKKSKSSSDSDSDSESSDESLKKKKGKKLGKRKRYSSESSDSDKKREKVKSKSNKISKKLKKARRSSGSSDSDDSDESSDENKKEKKGKPKFGDEKSDKISELKFRDDLLLEEPDIKIEKHWESQKTWVKPEERSKKTKEDDDWEASSSVEKSEQESGVRESSWNEEAEVRGILEENKSEEIRKSQVISEKDMNYLTDTSDGNQLGSETLKTSMSNFSFNENSFCSFGQELSRDFFLAERSYSNSGNFANSESLRTTLIDPRPFQSVSKDSESKKPADSERYSPGYSDSELSDVEIKCEKANSVSNADSGTREDVYDPLNCESEGSADNNEIELSSIPLPHAPDVLLSERKSFENISLISTNSEGVASNDFLRKEAIPTVLFPCVTSSVRSSFTSSDFTPIVTYQSPFNNEKNTPTKRQLMSVKGQQKLISKAASVFQDESDEENIEPNPKETENAQGLKQKEDEGKSIEEEKKHYGDEKYIKKRKKETRDKSRERSKEREGRRRRSRSQESRDSSKTYSRKTSPGRRRKSKTPEPSREKREIRSDSFEIEPLKSTVDSNGLDDMVQPIPVLTGLEATSSEGLWNRTLIPGCEFSHSSDNLIDHAESFDIYPSEESIRNRNYSRDYVDQEKTSTDKSRDQRTKKERRKSRSRSYSPRKKMRSKSPERRKSPRNRSPRRKSASPKRKDKSPYSPRRRSPKRKSPSRRYKRKSSSRSPRKRRGSPSRRSRSVSPRKYRNSKRREESPRRTLSPRDRFSPRKDIRYSQSYSNGLQNRIPVIGDREMELSPSAMRSPYEGPMGFPRHIPDSSVAESEMYGSFYEGEYADEFGISSYSEDVGIHNLITVKNHDIEKANSPERLSLDQRIELELGVQMSGSQTGNDQYQMQNQVCPPFQENNFQNAYNCDNSNDNFYQNQNVQINADFNGQYFNGHQQQTPSNYGSFQQYPNSQPVQNSVLQVGNIVEVVPTLQHPPPPTSSVSAKAPQIMQVGNVLQVVPSPKAIPQVPSQNYVPLDASPQVKTQKATAVVAPSSIIPTPNPEAVLSPLIKAIQLEREKRRAEREKRKAEREARRKARQLRREAKLMSVNEKLKKSVQNEGLMLGQEVEDDELLDGLDVPSPPIPVEIITVSSVSALPPAGKGILITAGFMPKPPSEKKEVKFADGVCPGEGTSTSDGEDILSPPPKPKLPKEKRFKKKKTKMKKKVKVQIIRQIIQEDDDEDDLSPPPPPPGDPPLVLFARFPFAGEAQFPVYQTQTTTTLTTVQYPAQTFE